MSEATSGWSAECRDCDYTIGIDYGERIYPRSESGDRGDVEFWAEQHRRRNPDTGRGSARLRG